MKVVLMTPQGRVYSGEAEDVVLQAARGEMNVLERHANLIAKVVPGTLGIRGGGAEKKFKVSDGFVRIQGEACSILCMKAESI